MSSLRFKNKKILKNKFKLKNRLIYNYNYYNLFTNNDTKIKTNHYLNVLNNNNNSIDSSYPLNAVTNTTNNILYKYNNKNNLFNNELSSHEYLLLNNHFTNLDLLLDSKYYNKFNLYNKISDDDDEIKLPNNLDFRYSYTLPENFKKNKVNTSFVSSKLKKKFMRRYRFIYRFFYNRNLFKNRQEMAKYRKQLFAIFSSKEKIIKKPSIKFHTFKIFNILKLNKITNFNSKVLKFLYLKKLFLNRVNRVNRVRSTLFPRRTRILLFRLFLKKILYRKYLLKNKLFNTSVSTNKLSNKIITNHLDLDYKIKNKKFHSFLFFNKKSKKNYNRFSKALKINNYLNNYLLEKKNNNFIEYKNYNNEIVYSKNKYLIILNKYLNKIFNLKPIHFKINNYLKNKIKKLNSRRKFFIKNIKKENISASKHNKLNNKQNNKLDNNTYNKYNSRFNNKFNNKPNNKFNNKFNNKYNDKYNNKFNNKFNNKYYNKKEDGKNTFYNKNNYFSNKDTKSNNNKLNNNNYYHNKYNNKNSINKLNNKQKNNNNYNNKNNNNNIRYNNTKYNNNKYNKNYNHKLSSTNNKKNNKFTKNNNQIIKYNLNKKGKKNKKLIKLNSKLVSLNSTSNRFNKKIKKFNNKVKKRNLLLKQVEKYIKKPIYFLSFKKNISKVNNSNVNKNSKIVNLIKLSNSLNKDYSFSYILYIHHTIKKLNSISSLITNLKYNTKYLVNLFLKSLSSFNLTSFLSSKLNFNKYKLSLAVKKVKKELFNFFFSSILKIQNKVLSNLYNFTYKLELFVLNLFYGTHYYNNEFLFNRFLKTFNNKYLFSSLENSNFINIDVDSNNLKFIFNKGIFKSLIGSYNCKINSNNNLNLNLDLLYVNPKYTLNNNNNTILFSPKLTIKDNYKYLRSSFISNIICKINRLLNYDFDVIYKKKYRFLDVNTRISRNIFINMNDDLVKKHIEYIKTNKSHELNDIIKSLVVKVKGKNKLDLSRLFTFRAYEYYIIIFLNKKNKFKALKYLSYLSNYLKEVKDAKKIKNLHFFIYKNRNINFIHKNNRLKIRHYNLVISLYKYLIKFIKFSNKHKYKFISIHRYLNKLHKDIYSHFKFETNINKKNKKKIRTRLINKINPSIKNKKLAYYNYINQHLEDISKSDNLAFTFKKFNRFKSRFKSKLKSIYKSKSKSKFQLKSKSKSKFQLKFKPKLKLTSNLKSKLKLKSRLRFKSRKAFNRFIKMSRLSRLIKKKSNFGISIKDQNYISNKITNFNKVNKFNKINSNKFFIFDNNIKLLSKKKLKDIKIYNAHKFVNRKINSINYKKRINKNRIRFIKYNNFLNKINFKLDNISSNVKFKNSSILNNNLFSDSNSDLLYSSDTSINQFYSNSNNNKSNKEKSNDFFNDDNYDLDDADMNFGNELVDDLDNITLDSSNNIDSKYLISYFKIYNNYLFLYELCKKYTSENIKLLNKLINTIKYKKSKLFKSYNLLSFINYILVSTKKLLFKIKNYKLVNINNMLKFNNKNKLLEFNILNNLYLLDLKCYTNIKLDDYLLENKDQIYNNSNSNLLNLSSNFINYYNRKINLNNFNYNNFVSFYSSLLYKASDGSIDEFNYKEFIKINKFVNNFNRKKSNKINKEDKNVLNNINSSNTAVNSVTHYIGFDDNSYKFPKGSINNINFFDSISNINFIDYKVLFSRLMIFIRNINSHNNSKKKIYYKNLILKFKFLYNLCHSSRKNKLSKSSLKHTNYLLKLDNYYNLNYFMILRKKIIDNYKYMEKVNKLIMLNRYKNIYINIVSYYSDDLLFDFSVINYNNYYLYNYWNNNSLYLKFVGFLNKEGKKNKAEKIFDNSLQLIKNFIFINPIFFFYKTIYSLQPIFENTKLKIKTKTFSNSRIIPYHKRSSICMRDICKNLRNNKLLRNFRKYNKQKLSNSYVLYYLITSGYFLKGEFKNKINKDMDSTYNKRHLVNIKTSKQREENIKKKEIRKEINKEIYLSDHKNENKENIKVKEKEDKNNKHLNKNIENKTNTNSNSYFLNVDKDKKKNKPRRRNKFNILKFLSIKKVRGYRFT